MTIYVDEIRTYPGPKHNERWAHMWTDGEDAELDAFAAKLELKREWAHTSHGMIGRFYHYDLTPGKRAQAMIRGAQAMRLKDWIASKMGGKCPVCGQQSVDLQQHINAVH